ncbi:MAG: arginine--tRNA ligase [Eubacteriales bacterium]|nr:arginine--tRNA ligase [Eubacteriales bacterium]
MDYRQALAEYLSGIVSLDCETISGLLEIPPQETMGDFAFPCFALAKLLRKSPVQIASDLKSTIDASEAAPEFLARCEAVGAYLNFFIQANVYVLNTLATVLTQTGGYAAFDGRSLLDAAFESDERKQVLIEYSSPNIAKPFHVGHAFSTILGAALARIYSLAGFEVVRMNHLGDYGTQFGKLIVAYENYGDSEALEADPISELLRVYVKFHQEVEVHPELEDEARERFRRLENHEANEEALFLKFRDISIQSFKRIYKRLGVDFDNWNGESFYSDKIPEVVELMRERGVLEASEGCQVVRFDDPNLPPCLVLKSDGTTTYASRDLASVLYRERNYHFVKNIYVVGLPQSLHFKQVFAALERMNFDFAKRCEFVGFGLVKFGEGNFSTRSGNVIELETLLNEAVKKTRAIMVENAEMRSETMDEEEIDRLAEKVGVAAVIYQFVKNGRERDILFSWEDMLDFDGDTAPYLLYTGARAHSILRRSGLLDELAGLDAMDFQALAGDEEALRLTKTMEAYRVSVQQAFKQSEPFLIARALNALCRQFNRFYTRCGILKTEDLELRKFRLLLCLAFWTCLKEGLAILGIEAVERM